MRRSIIIAIILALSPILAFAQSTAPDSAAISATVQRFHKALTKGDKAAALELFAPDAVILESGAEQTRDEYACEHLAQDIAFAKTTQSTMSDFAVHQEGGVAWTTATTNSTGTFEGHDVNSVGVELTILTKTEAGWRIRAVHWSSHRR